MPFGTHIVQHATYLQRRAHIRRECAPTHHGTRVMVRGCTLPMLKCTTTCQRAWCRQVIQVNSARLNPSTHSQVSAHRHARIQTQRSRQRGVLKECGTDLVQVLEEIQMLSEVQEKTQRPPQTMDWHMNGYQWSHQQGHEQRRVETR